MFLHPLSCEAYRQIDDSFADITGCLRFLAQRPIELPRPDGQFHLKPLEYREEMMQVGGMQVLVMREVMRGAGQEILPESEHFLRQENYFQVAGELFGQRVIVRIEQLAGGRQAWSSKTEEPQFVVGVTFPDHVADTTSQLRRMSFLWSIDGKLQEIKMSQAYKRGDAKSEAYFDVISVMADKVLLLAGKQYYPDSSIPERPHQETSAHHQRVELTREKVTIYDPFGPAPRSVPKTILHEQPLSRLFKYKANSQDGGLFGDGFTLTASSRSDVFEVRCKSGLSTSLPLLLTDEISSAYSATGYDGNNLEVAFNGIFSQFQNIMEQLVVVSKDMFLWQENQTVPKTVIKSDLGESL